MEEENKSLRFLGLANTPLANASLEGEGGLDSRQESRGAGNIFLQNQRNTLVDSERYIYANTPLANASLEEGGRVGFKPELGSRQGS